MGIGSFELVHPSRAILRGVRRGFFRVQWRVLVKEY